MEIITSIISAIITTGVLSFPVKCWINKKIESEFDLLKHRDLTRHNDKISLFKEVITSISEILRELESVMLGDRELNSEVLYKFSLDRMKNYGYITLVSTQEVMDEYNNFLDYLIPIIHEEKTLIWEDMRGRADTLLNAMRKELKVSDGDIFYQGVR